MIDLSESQVSSTGKLEIIALGDLAINAHFVGLGGTRDFVMTKRKSVPTKE